MDAIDWDSKHYILKDGEMVETDLLTWARWFEKSENRRVAWTEVGDVKISTVFLGINQGFGSVPKWFKTMIFSGEHDEYCDRYTTLEEAMAGHERAVALVRGDA